MARVLVVPIAEWKDAQTFFRRALNSQDVVLFAYDFGRKSLTPKDQLGLAYGAEACVVGFNPKTVSALQSEYQLVLDPPDTLKGTVKGNHQAIQKWLVRGAIVAPIPTFKEIAEEAAQDYTRLLFSADALDKANQVSCSPDHGAEQFPEFLRQAIHALGRLSQAVKSVGSLDTFFAQEAALARFASSGKEHVEYQDSLNGGAKRSSRLHLIPKTERSGFHDRCIKPRLYFDVTTIKGQERAEGEPLKYVLVLYFGPHPEPACKWAAGSLAIKAIDDRQA